MLGRKNSNILVIKTDGLTGFVAADAAFEAIREAHPHAKISLLTTPGLQRIARASPYFDQVAGMPNMRDGEARREFVRQLKSSKFEKVYDLSGDDAARRLKGALGPFGPKWHMADFAGKPSKGATPSFDKLAETAGLSISERLPDLSWAVTARKDSANMQPSWYGISGPFGLLLPGEAADRRWSAAGYAGVAREMSQAGIMPVLAGAKSLHNFGDEIAHDAPQLVDLTGKTDHLQLAALAREALFFVSDSADEMQLALSVGCEGVVIRSPKEPFEITGRHVVTMTAPEGARGAGLGEVEPVFVWRTLNNMGLINLPEGEPISAQAR